MGLRFKDQDLGQCFFVTTSFHEHHPWGNLPGVYEILAEALNFRIAKTDSKILSYVLMPSHLHLLMAIDGKVLSNFIRDFKKFTAQKSLASICSTNKIWQDRFDRQAIWTEKILMTKLNYIHFNPLRAGLAENIEDWYWSSAVDYMGRENGSIHVWKDWR
jgi:putative transposase